MSTELSKEALAVAHSFGHDVPGLINGNLLPLAGNPITRQRVMDTMREMAERIAELERELATARTNAPGVPAPPLSLDESVCPCWADGQAWRRRYDSLRRASVAMVFDALAVGAAAGYALRGLVGN